MGKPLSARRETPPAPSPPGTHEWVSFDDPDEERTWVFDVTFLLSHWNCIYGKGCQGVLTGPAPERHEGCCSYGAHLTDEADARRVRRAASALTSSQWQYRARAAGQPLKRNRAGEALTRIADGACIFLNRPGFPGGPGCALHRAALETGRAPRHLKPDVCWQLPLRRDDEDGPGGRVVSTITQWDREHWGAGGGDFHWWCTEAPEAFSADRPVYVGLRDELVAMVGPSVYRSLARYLSARRAGSVPVPHPVLRRR